MPLFNRRSTTSSPVTLEYVGNAVSGANATAYTFSSHALGTAGATRQVVVGASGTTSSVIAVSTLTVAGVSAALVVASPAAGEGSTELWVAAVPTGTTGDIVVTWASAQARCGIGVWAIFDAATGASATAVSVAAPLSASLTIPPGGVGIGQAHVATGATATWANLTEDFDADTEASRDYSGASSDTAGSPTITCTWTSSANPAMAVAAWGPS